MISPGSSTHVEQLQSLMDELTNHLIDIPVELKEQIDKDLQKIQTCIADLLQIQTSDSLNLVQGFDPSENAQASLAAEITVKENAQDDVQALNEPHTIEISERKRSIEALQAREEQLRRVCRAGRIGLYEWDTSQNTIYWSPETYELFGLEPNSEASYEQWIACLHPDDRERANRDLAEILKNDHSERRAVPLRNEYRVLHADGTVLWLDATSVFDLENGALFMRGAVRDITERKQAEERFNYQAFLLENVPAPIIGTDQELAIIYWNKAAEEFYGWKAEDVMGRKPGELLNSEINEEQRALAVQQMAEKGYYSLEVSQITRDGHKVLISGNTYALRGSQGEVIGYISTNRDITERKQEMLALENALAQVENEKNRLLAIMEALPIGLAILDQKGGGIQANRAYEELWGSPRPPANSVDDYDAYKAWWVESGLRVQPQEWASARAVQKGETVTGQLMEIQRFDGTRGFILNSGAPVRDVQGNITGSAVAIMDITAQRLMEIEQREHLVQMEIQRRLLENRERERQLIARDLHDGPVQDLSSLIFNIKLAREAIQDPMIQVEIDRIGLALKTVIQNLREMMNALRPPSLMRFGLVKALQVYLDDFRVKHPEIELETDMRDDEDCLSEQARVNLYRIAQEAIGNTVKHSHATKVAIRLDWSEHQAVLEISDKGYGFSVANDFITYTVDNHFGLVGMRERAEALGGKFSISSEKNVGTTIIVSVPIEGRKRLE